MKKIELNKGKFALVDDSDFEFCNQWKWYFSNSYAVRKPWKSKSIWMHRLINKTPDGFDTDHINRNRLDNRRKNLRTVTEQQNSHNTNLRKDNTSGYRGVHWYKKDKKWGAGISINNKAIHLGFFDDPREAAKAYNEAAIKYHGEFASLNNLKEENG